MRNPLRIPIFLDIIERTENPFREKVIEHRKDIELFWLENYDLRWTQVALHFGYPNLPGSWFYEEDDDLLVRNGLCNYEDILFWGRNYDKEGNLLPKTEHVLIKDLTTDHMEAIIKHLAEHGKVLPPKYLNYFQQRINNQKQIK